jgi:hypothetical protein
LGAAIFSNEDPFTRSMAYIVAETLDIEPHLPTDHDFYNAFADPEANQRHHHELCADALDRCLSHTILQNDHYVFLDEWVRQNKRLLAGEFMGWCAPALVRCLQVFNARDQEPQDMVEAAKDVFEQTLNDISWELVRKLGMRINAERAQGRDLLQDDILKILQGDPAFGSIAKILSFDIFETRRDVSKS